MIPEAAVEAAAKAITARYGDPAKRWKQDVDDATAALEAAAPVIAAQALEEAADAMREERHGWCLDDAGRYWINRTLDELRARANEIRK